MKIRLFKRDAAHRRCMDCMHEAPVHGVTDMEGEPMCCICKRSMTHRSRTAAHPCGLFKSKTT